MIGCALIVIFVVTFLLIQRFTRSEPFRMNTTNSEDETEEVINHSTNKSLYEQLQFGIAKNREAPCISTNSALHGEKYDHLPQVCAEVSLESFSHCESTTPSPSSIVLSPFTAIHPQKHDSENHCHHHLDNDHHYYDHHDDDDEEKQEDEDKYGISRLHRSATVDCNTQKLQEGCRKYPNHPEKYVWDYSPTHRRSKSTFL